MLTVDKNLKDTVNDPQITITGSPLFKMSYTKTDKLITALYMVTDIIDKHEPLRNKLRTLGTEIILDINSSPLNACIKISEIMSFLNIASSMNIISGMNCSILRKEFFELDRSIKEYMNITEPLNKPTNLSEFLRDDSPNIEEQYAIERQSYSIGHYTPTRIGVQKGSTLLQALSKVKESKSLSNTTNTTPFSYQSKNRNTRDNNFLILKKQRRDRIISVIKFSGGSSTIKDIREQINIGLSKEEICSEKTVQRELMSMIKDDVLYKIGEKRWSKYFIKN